MSDGVPEAEVAAAGADEAEGAEGGGGGIDTATLQRSRRAWPWVTARIAAVLVVGAVGFVLVVPVSPTVASRASLLVTARTGVGDFPGPARQHAQRSPSALQLAALTAAASRSPRSTAVSVSGWSAGRDQALVVGILTPSPADARRVRAQLEAAALSVNAYVGAGLVRTGTATVAGTPGAHVSLYATPPGAPATASASAGTEVDSAGAVVSLVEVARKTGPARDDLLALARTQGAHLRSVAPGFTLAPTRYPTASSALWVSGTVVVGLAAGLGPVALRRRRRAAEDRRRAEMERTIRVGGSTIVRTRRGS